jgi:hypothetical protein
MKQVVIAVAMVFGCEGVAGAETLNVLSEPAGVQFELESSPGTVHVAPASLDVAPGTYRIVILDPDGGRRVSEVKVKKGGREATVLLEGPRQRVVDPNAPKQIDMTDGEPIEESSGPPPKIKHPSMLKDKYQRGLQTNETWFETGPKRVAANRRTIGLRAGGGAAILDGDNATAMRLTAVGRQPVHEAIAIEARADTTRRSIDMTSAWAIGGGIGARAFVVRRASASLSATAGVRGELRLGDLPGLAGGDVAAIGGLAIGFADHRIAIEVRGELGVSDHVALVEIGVDL